MAITLIIDGIRHVCGEDLDLNLEIVSGTSFEWQLEITGDDRVVDEEFTINTFGTDLLEEATQKITTVTGDDPVLLLIKSKPDGFKEVGVKKLTIMRVSDLHNMAVINLTVKAPPVTGLPPSGVPPAKPIPPASPVPPSSGVPPRSSCPPPASPPSASPLASSTPPKPTASPETSRSKARPIPPSADPHPPSADLETRTFSPLFLRKLVTGGLIVLLVSFLGCSGMIGWFFIKSSSLFFDWVSPEKEEVTPIEETSSASAPPNGTPPPVAETPSENPRPRVLKGRAQPSP